MSERDRKRIEEMKVKARRGERKKKERRGKEKRDRQPERRALTVYL